MAVESYGAWGCDAQNTFSHLLAINLVRSIDYDKIPGTIKFVLQNGHHTGQSKCKGYALHQRAYLIASISLLIFRCVFCNQI